MKKLLLLLTVFLSSIASYGQSTTYTGTIKDLSLNVVTSGQVTFTLTPKTDATIPGTGRFTPSTVTCNINSDGTLSGFVGGTVSGACTVAMNAAISPSGTSYRVCIQPNYATPGSCFFDYAVTSTKDISTVAPTLATGPINYGGIPGLPGPQGPTGPAGTTTATGTNGGFNVPGIITNLRYSTFNMFPNFNMNTIATGDSICVGTGTTSPNGPNGLFYYSPNRNAFETLLATQVGGTNDNRCEGGSMTADAVDQMFQGNYTPKLSDNPLFIENAGANEDFWCEQQTGNTVGCRANAQLAHTTLATWSSTSYKLFGLNMTASGSWSTDTHLPIFARKSTTNGSSLTAGYTVPNNVNSFCVAWEALDANGGAAVLNVDGTNVDTLNAFGNNGQSVKTGFVANTWTVWSKCYTSTPGVHNITITVSSSTSSSNVFAFVGILSPTDPTKHYYGSPRMVSTGVSYQENDADSSVTAFYDTQKKNNIAALVAMGWQVAFADIRAYMDYVYDMSATPITKPDGTVCPGSTQPGAHPNDCGHMDIYRAIAAVVSPNRGTEIPVLNVFAGAPASAEDFSSVNKNGLASQTALNPGINIESGGSTSGRDFGQMLTFVPALIAPNGGAITPSYSNTTYIPSGNYMSGAYYPDSSTPPTSQSQFTYIYTASPSGFISFVPMAVPSIQMGAGSALSSFVSYLVSFTPTSVAANTCAPQTFSVPGVTISDQFTQLRVPPGYPGIGPYPQIIPAATGTVSVMFCNLTGSAATPTSGQYAWGAFH